MLVRPFPTRLRRRINDNEKESKTYCTNFTIKQSNGNPTINIGAIADVWFVDTLAILIKLSLPTMSSIVQTLTASNIYRAQRRFSLFGDGCSFNKKRGLHPACPRPRRLGFLANKNLNLDQKLRIVLMN